MGRRQSIEPPFPPGWWLNQVHAHFSRRRWASSYPPSRTVRLEIDSSDDGHLALIREDWTPPSIFIWVEMDHRLSLQLISQTRRPDSLLLRLDLRPVFQVIAPVIGAIEETLLIRDEDRATIDRIQVRWTSYPFLGEG